MSKASKASKAVEALAKKFLRVEGRLNRTFNEAEAANASALRALDQGREILEELKRVRMGTEGPLLVSDSGKVINYNGKNFLEYNEWNERTIKKMNREIAPTISARAVWDAMGTRGLEMPNETEVLERLKRRLSLPSDTEWRQRIFRALGGQLGAVTYTLPEAVVVIEEIVKSDGYRWRQAMGEALGVQPGEKNFSMEEAARLVTTMRSGQPRLENVAGMKVKFDPTLDHQAEHLPEEECVARTHGKSAAKESVLDGEAAPIGGRIIKDNPQA